MDYNLQLIIEAAIVGISVMIMGTIVTYTWTTISGRSTKFIWNLAMFASLFLIGFLLHLFYEFAGLNKYYCKIFSKTRK
jgi:hypothetical protein|tara:strand:- start:373 stop:609 length:237 start_codon:yes stop_codon:yes gene_type:complete